MNEFLIELSFFAFSFFVVLFAIWVAKCFRIAFTVILKNSYKDLSEKERVILAVIGAVFYTVCFVASIAFYTCLIVCKVVYE